MSTTCIPATAEPVDVTAAARAAGLRTGFRVVMTGDAHHRARARAHGEHPGTEDGVRAVVDAVAATLAALIETEATLDVGTAWTVRTGYLTPDRWTVLVAADETDRGSVVLYIAPAG